MIDGKRAIKARITMRGFKDSQQDMETFVGTATRMSQRVVTSITALHKDWFQWSFDVPQAFAKGMTFQEMSKLTGDPIRSVQVLLRPDDVEVIRAIPGYEDFDPARECLDMVKAVYGLKDAPRAWRFELHLVLVAFGLVPTLADPQI